ncbi:MAG: hypothetical protein KAX80_13070 [Planctomycetes bacterium]|nr:hypothetical protein [Planctomycetota bacterium]
MLKRVEEMSRGSRVRVGLGYASQGDAAALTAARAEDVGLGPIELYDTPADLIDALTGGAIDAAVRGTLSSHEALPLLLERTGVASADRAVLMDLGGDRTFVLTPVGIDEGRDLRERWNILKGAARLVSLLGLEPRAAVMAMGREEDADRGEAISLSVRECDALKDAAKAEGISAECVGIQVERAVEVGNVIIAPDGVTGNLMFRSLHLIAGNESWGATALGVMPLVFVDTSRQKDDYMGPIHLARALASRAPTR